MKKAIIWAVTMGLITTIFGVQLGLIPGLILSWVISDLVDKSEEKKDETVKCPNCNTMNNKTNEFCKECGESLHNQTKNVTDTPILNKEENLVTETLEEKDDEKKLEENKEKIKFQKTKGSKPAEPDNKTTIPIIESSTKKKAKTEKGKEKIVLKAEKKEEKSKKKAIEIESDTNIRFCRKCGTELSSDSLFCRKCGTKIEV